MQKIKFTAKSHPEPNMTIDKLYTPLAFSKRFDSYRVKNDEGFTDWHHMSNFEIAKGEARLGNESDI